MNGGDQSSREDDLDRPRTGRFSRTDRLHKQDRSTTAVCARRPHHLSAGADRIPRAAQDHADAEVRTRRSLRLRPGRDGSARSGDHHAAQPSLRSPASARRPGQTSGAHGDTAGEATLCTYPVLFVPSLDERVLLQSEAAVLDRLAVDIESTTGSVAPRSGPSEQPTARGLTDGHVPMAEINAPVPVRRILLASPPTAGPPSPASVAAMLCATALVGARESVLTAVAAILERAQLVQVNVHDRSALYSMLR